MTRNQLDPHICHAVRTHLVNLEVSKVSNLKFPIFKFNARDESTHDRIP